jgi:hypothetical protein
MVWLCKLSLLLQLFYLFRWKILSVLSFINSSFKKLNRSKKYVRQISLKALGKLSASPKRVLK